MSRESSVSRKISTCLFWWCFSCTHYPCGGGVHITWIHQVCWIMQLQPNYGSDTVTHMFNIQNRPETKYFYNSLLGFYIQSSDPKELCSFDLTFKLLMHYFYALFHYICVISKMRIEVQLTSVNICTVMHMTYKCCWKTRTQHAQNGLKCPDHVKKQPRVHISWRDHEKCTAFCFNENYNPAGIFDVEATLNGRRNFDVEKALKNVRIFRRSSKKGWNFDGRWNIDVDSTSIFQRFFYSASKKRRKSVENSTSKFARWEMCNFAILTFLKYCEERRKINVHIHTLFSLFFINIPYFLRTKLHKNKSTFKILKKTAGMRLFLWYVELSVYNCYADSDEDEENKRMCSSEDEKPPACPDCVCLYV